MIFVGKADGRIHVWDLIDQSHKESSEIQVGNEGIRTMRFHQKKHDIMAVGDEKG